MAVEAGVADVGFCGLGPELVEPAADDRSQQCLEVVVAGDEVLGERVHQGDVGRRIGRTQVVDRLDQAASQQVADVAIDDVLREEGVLLAGQPLGQWDAKIEGMFERLATQGRGLAGGARLDHHNRFASEQPELLAALGPHPLEEGGEAVVVALAVLLEGMMMTLGTFEPDAQEQLCGRFGQVVGVAVDPEVVGRSGGVDRALGGDQFTDEAVEALVGPERLADPVVQCPHPLFAQLVAAVANQVRPLQRPPGGVEVVEAIPGGVAGLSEQFVDQPLPLVGPFRVDEGHRRLG